MIHYNIARDYSILPQASSEVKCWSEGAGSSPSPLSWPTAQDGDRGIGGSGLESQNGADP